MSCSFYSTVFLESGQFRMKYSIYVIAFQQSQYKKMIDTDTFTVI
jgi:hypothetical protein